MINCLLLKKNKKTNTKTKNKNKKKTTNIKKNSFKKQFIQKKFFSLKKLQFWLEKQVKEGQIYRKNCP